MLEDVYSSVFRVMHRVCDDDDDDKYIAANVSEEPAGSLKVVQMSSRCHIPEDLNVIQFPCGQC